MTNLEMPGTTSRITPVENEAEPLLELQLLVARRADVLARRNLPGTRDVDRRMWLRAEFEVFERAGRIEFASQAVR
jgi:hypothetical protein